MAMVDRYKKSGGFVQLLQVIETCGPKKQEQFMNIIKDETPNWSEAISQRLLSFDKIISWQSETLLEITANVNTLAFVTALKSLSPEKYQEFCKKLSSNEQRKIDQQYKDISPDANQISSCVMKVVSETRNLFVSGTLKFDKVDPLLSIPENIESQLGDGSSGGSSVSSSAKVADKPASESASAALSMPSGALMDLDQFKKKFIELNQQVALLKKENAAMKDKLDRIKKIA